VPGGEGQQGDVAGLLDCAGEAALVRGANAGQAPGHDLAALGHELLQETDVPVGDGVDLVGAELADLFAAEKLAAAAGTAGAWTARSVAWARTMSGAWSGALSLAWSRSWAGFGLLGTVRSGGRLYLVFISHCGSSSSFPVLFLRWAGVNLLRPDSHSLGAEAPG
jgi:hypothetical protein